MRPGAPNPGEAVRFCSVVPRASARATIRDQRGLQIRAAGFDSSVACHVDSRSRSPTGRGSSFRTCTLWVRIPPRLRFQKFAWRSGSGAMPRDVDRLVSAFASGGRFTAAARSVQGPTGQQRDLKVEGSTPSAEESSAWLSGRASGCKPVEGVAAPKKPSRPRGIGVPTAGAVTLRRPFRRPGDARRGAGRRPSSRRPPPAQPDDPHHLHGGRPAVGERALQEGSAAAIRNAVASSADRRAGPLRPL
jgi:hypothetical protein